MLLVYLGNIRMLIGFNGTKSFENFNDKVKIINLDYFENYTYNPHLHNRFNINGLYIHFSLKNS